MAENFLSIVPHSIPVELVFFRFFYTKVLPQISSTSPTAFNQRSPPVIPPFNHPSQKSGLPSVSKLLPIPSIRFPFQASFLQVDDILRTDLLSDLCLCLRAWLGPAVSIWECNAANCAGSPRYEYYGTASVRSALTAIIGTRARNGRL
jgi:hypothetical protein